MWQPVSLSSSLDARITGTRIDSVVNDLLHNSAHFPLWVVTIDLLEYLTDGAAGLGHPPLVLAYPIAALLQAWFLGARAYAGRPAPLRGNLIGPALVTVATLGLAGFADSIAQPQVWLYWIFSLAIGLVQTLRLVGRAVWVKHAAILGESVVRASMPLSLFWMFHEMGGSSDSVNWLGMLEEPYHLYVVVVLPLFGALIGLANVTAFRYHDVLRETARQLRQYSEWFAGPDLLRRMVADPAVLRLRSEERTVFFMDIRAFTRWSAEAAPETVVALVDAYYQAAEECLMRVGAVKLEFTGDEVLAVFARPEQAIAGAEAALANVRPLLLPHGLDVGIGINAGPLIEGLVGGSRLKKFAVMGHTVNIGKRICEQAAPGQVVLADEVAASLGDRISVSAPRSVTFKGFPRSVRVRLLRTC